MKDKRVALLLVGILSSIALLVGSMAIAMLYQTAIKEGGAHLRSMVQSQARLIEAMARHEREVSERLGQEPSTAIATVLSQVRDAHRHYAGLGATGEFTLARREGAHLVFLLSLRHDHPDKEKPLPFNIEKAEPMQLALSGRSGIIVGADYRGERVLAAYEPVALLDLGLVAKIDLSEIRAPFVRAGMTTFAMTFGLVLIGTILFFRITRPLLTKLQERERLLDNVLENIPHFVFWKDRDSIYLGCNRQFAKVAGVDSPAAIVGKTDYELAWETAEADFYRNVDRAVMESRVPQLNIEESQRQADGTEATLLTSKVPLRSATNQVIGILGIYADITERKRTETALRESEQRFHQMAETIGEVFWLLPPDYQSILYISPAFEQVWGRPCAELYANPLLWLEAIHPEDTSRVVHALEGLAKGESYDMEFRITRPDGTVRWVRDRGYARRDATGKVVLTSGVVSDITARRKAEAQLPKLARAVEQSPASVVITNLAADIEYVNPKFTEITGYTLDEVRGENPRLLKSGKIPAEVYTCLWRTITSGEEWRGELLNKKKNGTLYWEYASISPIKDQDGTITHFLAVKEDITGRKAAEQCLRDSEERFRALVETSSDWIWEVDRHGRYSYVSPKVKDLLGYEPEEVLGRTCFDLMPSAEQTPIAAAFRKLMEARAPFAAVENLCQRKDGTLAVLETSGVPIFEASGQFAGYRGVDREVTERKTSEIEREALQRRLVDMSRQAGMAEVATGVLHNVGNVLNSLNVSASLVADKLRASRTPRLARIARMLSDHADDLATFLCQDEKGRQLPQYLTSLAQHLASEHDLFTREVDSLLTNVQHIRQVIARQQTYTGLSGVLEPVAAQTVVNDALAIQAVHLCEIEVVREFAALSPILMDRHKLLQILLNLVQNAKHALNERGAEQKRLLARVNLTENNRVRMQIVDNGIGIPREHLMRVFEFGFTTKATGHGFGLHASALAARELGGTLTCESDGPGQGATFTPEIPFKRAEAMA